jgi:hypothetical protein
MLISNPLKICKKTHAKKVIFEKVTEKLSFKCFCIFCNGVELASNFAFDVS